MRALEKRCGNGLTKGSKMIVEKYLVWYVKPDGTQYCKEFTFDQILEQDHLDEICDCPLAKEYKIGDMCEGVGVTDVDNKELFLDSSIFEFMEPKDGRLYFGILEWNSEEKRVEIEAFFRGSGEFNGFYNDLTMELKFVGTKQQDGHLITKLKKERKWDITKNYTEK